jgi:hypothetical protein
VGQRAKTIERGVVPAVRPATIEVRRRARREDTMDHYIPKRRVPVTLWSRALPGVEGLIFLDLDAASNRHQTILEKLNESARFLPLAVGEDGRTHLVSKAALQRVTVGRQVLQSDIYSRGFQPWREEEAELLLEDGTNLTGRVWMPLQRESQRVSDFMNELGGGFFVLLSPGGVHLLNAGAVIQIVLAESAGAPLAGDSF